MSMDQGPRNDRPPLIEVEGLGKTFTLYNQNDAVIPVMQNASLRVAAGEAVALTGESGAGKSSLMRMLYGNYRAQTGSIRIRHRDHWVDVASAEPHAILDLRRETLGYVSQFLRVIPRVSTLDVVSEPLVRLGVEPTAAHEKARELLTRLRIPQTLWLLSPLTFSGGEQQRVNIARGFAHRFPCLLLDEPTASLDKLNRETVLDMIEEAKADGVAVIGIFHDAEARRRVCDREIDVSSFAVGRTAA
ncbi:MAG: phosphonate C-P lyase system protein PhnL [Pseudomonadota bacterium]